MKLSFTKKIYCFNLIQKFIFFLHGGLGGRLLFLTGDLEEEVFFDFIDNLILL